MTTWARGLGAAALIGAVLVPVTAGPGSAAVPAPLSSTSVTTLPFSTATYGTLSGLSTPLTDPASRAVADACLPGQQIAAAQWALLAPDAPTTVIARTQPTSLTGRVQSPLRGGVAVVSAATLQVQSCAVRQGLSSVGPTVVGPAGAYLVSFVAASATPWTGQVLDDDWQLPLFVDRTTGVRPAGDDLAAATPITALPYSDTVDRYAATSEPTDTGWLDGNFCGSSVPGVDRVHRSVWYSFALAEPAVLDPAVPTSAPFLTTSGAAQLAEVTPTGLRSLECDAVHSGTGEVVLRPGVRYLVQVADYTVYGAPDGPVDQGAPRTLSLGGTARLLPAPAVALAVGATAALDARTGGAVVTGTVTCTGAARSLTVSGSLTQTGRGVSAGFTTTPTVRCDGTPQSWRAPAAPTGGRVALGSATVRVTAQVVNATGTGSATAARTLSVTRPASAPRAG